MQRGECSPQDFDILGTQRLQLIVHTPCMSKRWQVSFLFSLSGWYSYILPAFASLFIPSLPALHLCKLPCSLLRVREGLDLASGLLLFYCGRAPHHGCILVFHESFRKDQFPTSSSFIQLALCLFASSSIQQRPSPLWTDLSSPSIILPLAACMYTVACI